MTAKGGCVSRVWGSGSEGDICTTGNMDSERNYGVLMYSYRY
jgi:hypothetical protein